MMSSSPVSIRAQSLKYPATHNDDYDDDNDDDDEAAWNSLVRKRAWVLCHPP